MTQEAGDLSGATQITRVRARIQLIRLPGPSIPRNFPTKENERGHPPMDEQEMLECVLGELKWTE